MPSNRRDIVPKSHRREPGQSGPVSGSQQRRISRREREEKQRKRLYWAVGLAGALVILVLAGASLNEYVLKPRAVLATVDGTDIRRIDYWKYRAVDLADQANQYAQIANSPFIDQSQAQQYVTLAQQTSAEIDQVWGSTDLDDATLQKMIDDQIYLKNLDDMGIMLTDQDVQDYLDQRFGPADAPIFTPTPAPTLIPQRAEWATQTAIALEPTPEIGTPVVESASPVAGEASPVAATPDATVVAVVTEEATAAASPDTAGSPAPVDGTPVAEATPEVSPTPNQEQARQTATAQFEDYQDAIFDRAHLSRADYIRLIVRPTLARERITEVLTKDIGQSAEQVKASHILVDTQDLANSIYNDVTSGAVDFAQAAADQSIDSGTAPNGGDLGWFTKGQMVDEFEKVAFETPPGQIAPPFQTQFGWHIVRVEAHETDRAMTDEQINQLKTSTVDDWLAAQKAEMKISSEIKPTPTPAGPQNFVPPPDAPPTPTPTIEAPFFASPEVLPEVTAAP